MLQFHKLTLIAREAAALDAYALTLDEPESLRADYQFRAGQHLVIRAELEGRAVRRTYSIVSAEGGPLRIGVRVQGAVSRFLAHDLPTGGQLEVMTPNGRFTTAEQQRSRHYAAFAAGSGITPILSIVSTLLASRPEVRIWLFYGNRNAARTMFMPELMALKNRFMTRLSIHWIMSAEPQEVALFNGRIDGDKLRALAAGVFDAAEIDEFLVCGPGEMIDSVSAALAAIGAPGRVHHERFAAAAPRVAAAGKGQPVTAPASAAETAEVVMHMDGRRRSFTMARSGQSILEAAEQVGIELPFSCRDGICSTCRARVVGGSVTMQRNQALEPWEVEAGFVLCCQARPITANVELTYDEK